MAVATGVEPVPPDRQSGVLPLDSATTFEFGCEGTIRTCMNRFRAGYPTQLDDLAILRREPADTVCFLDKRSNRSLHHSSNSSSLLVNELPPLLTFKLAAGERFERPYPDSKSRVLPLDDPASHLQRNCFHAPNTQNGRFIEVVAESSAIRTCTVNQFAMISAAIAVKVRCKLDPKAFEFNRLNTHNFGSSEENRTPIPALKEPYPGR